MTPEPPYLDIDGPELRSEVREGTLLPGNGASWSVRFFSEDVLERDRVCVWRVPVPAFAHVYAPTYQGPLERCPLGELEPMEFRGPGWQHRLPDARRLSLPYVLIESDAGLALVGTDPAFHTEFAVEEGMLVVSWCYRAAAGSHEQTRRLVRFAADDLEAAVAGWFAAATPQIPAGPGWLREIALQDYDYFSKNGEGWYRDIDAVAELVEEGDRHRALFTLHGWYDRVGRFCFDERSETLDERWTVFPYMQSEQLLARELVEQPENNLPRGYAFRNLRDYRPVELDWGQVRDRLAYAKRRGFRTGFYLLTGMMALGDRDAHVADGTGLETEAVLWIGPDAVGETYLMNPLHPRVRRTILALTDALLERVGDLVDALVVDEAYYIGYGELGPAARPGYADQAQATLIQEIAERCHRCRPSLALLTADHLGTQTLEPKAYPYSLFADGIYHDAWCHGQAFQASQLPTWRNVVWSCNWAPLTEILSTKWAVLAFDAPIALSNGCFGDDVGFADMPAEARELIRDLWTVKMTRARKRALTVVDTTTSTEADAPTPAV